MSHKNLYKPTKETKSSAYEAAHTRQPIGQITTLSGFPEGDTRHLWHRLWQQIQRGQRTLHHIQQWLYERRLTLPHLTLPAHLSRSEWLAMAMAAGLMMGSLSQPLVAQAQEPVGGEFQVNTYTTRQQDHPDISMNADGDFIIVWDSYGQDGSTSGIYAQRYNANGVPQGAEFQVNSYTTNSQSRPSIGMDREGDFIIAWDSYGQDGSTSGIYAQRYNANGIPQGSEFQVNSYTTSSQSAVDVAMDGDGDFVIVWASFPQDGDSTGIYAQRYNANGIPQGSEFQVNSYTTSFQNSVDVAMDEDGNFVIVWNSFTQDGDTGGIYAQRYNANGIPQGSEFQVNSYTTSGQNNPTVGMDADGNFVIAWDSPSVNSLDIFAQRYSADGSPRGSEFIVNSFTSESQKNPTIAMNPDGDFVVTWFDRHDDIMGDLQDDIKAQLYSADGSPQGSEFQVNTFTSDQQFKQEVAMDANGNFVVTWVNYDDQDGHYYGIFAQRYRPTPEILISANNQEIIDGDTTPTLTDHTDFGNVIVGREKLARTFTISNTGADELTISTVNLTGTHASDFTVTQHPSSPVAINDSTSFQITFNPSVTGTQTVTASLTNNDPDENPYTFVIQGDSVSAESIGTDGISDAIENSGPNGGDGNEDGIPDSIQDNVASLPGDSGNYLTLESPDGSTLSNIAVTDTLPITPPVGARLSEGLIDFSLTNLTPGQTISLTLKVHSGETPRLYLKLQDGKWIQYDQVVIDGSDLILTLTDGGNGDDDGLANGTIIDPGALDFSTAVYLPVIKKDQ